MNIIEKKSHIHFIGIGGISMSAVAEILHREGHKITGSDANKSKQTDMLIATGVDVVIGHDLEKVKNADLIIYTNAIPETDPELMLAKNLNKTILERSDFMSVLTEKYPKCIGVSGSHGKTTTTSMISVILLEADKDPSIQVGAFLPEINANYRVGDSEYLVIESCEYRDSFLKFNPNTVVITNIDLEHLDYFKNLEQIKKSFADFIKKVPNDGYIVVCGDNKNVIDTINEYKDEFKGKIITYGKSDLNDYSYRNVQLYNLNDYQEGSSYELYKNNKKIMDVKLEIPGEYNVSNSVAAIIVSKLYGIEDKYILNGLKKFHGANRRFEYKGKINGVRIFDDYAHHPTEILALSESVKKLEKNESYGIFEAHTFSRLKYLLKDFAKSLINFDHIYIAPIYAAREENIYNISNEDLKTEINKIDKLKDVQIFNNFDEIKEHILKNSKENDIVVTIGAGNITKLGELILN